MSFTLTSIDTGKIGKRLPVWKHIQCTSQTQVLAAGATLDVKTHDAAVGFASTDWLLGSANIFGFAIGKDQFSGSVIVSLSANGSTFQQVMSFPLMGEGLVTFVSGVELAGGVARFTVLNGADSGISTFNIWLEVRSI